MGSDNQETNQVLVSRSYLGTVWRVCVLAWIKLLTLIGRRPLKSLDDEIILITGAAGGIGREICLNIARSCPKAILICWGTNPKTNQALVSELRMLGVKAHGYILDITDRVKVKEIAAQVTREVGSPTILINNAGIHHAAVPFLKLSCDSIDRSFQVNVVSQLCILQEFLPAMVENNHGHIITIGSILSHLPMKCSSVYGGTKHALRGFIESLRLELRADKKDIKFTNIYPGPVKTPFLNNFGVACPSTVVKTIFPLTMEAKRAADIIVDSFRREKGDVIFMISWPIVRMLPNWFQVFLVKYSTILLGLNFSEDAHS